MARRSSAFIPLAAALIGFASIASAQVTVVTPSNPQGWSGEVYGPGSAPGITTNFPRAGSGSVEFNMSDALNTEQDWVNEFSTTHALSSLTTLGFDWYRSSSSTIAPNFAPAFALHMSDGSYLVWERAYQTNNAPVPMDQWVTENLLGGSFWRSPQGSNTTAPCGSYGEFVSLSKFNTDCYGGGGQIAGLDLFFGEAAAGSFIAAIDNVSIGYNTQQPVTYNFEPDRMTATPEPASIALIATGFVGLGVVARRRRKA